MKIMLILKHFLIILKAATLLDTLFLQILEAGIRKFLYYKPVILRFAVDCGRGRPRSRGELKRDKKEAVKG